VAQQLTNPKEKIQFYREAAAEAEKSAARTSDAQTREGYLAVARTWIYLAEELEREMAIEDRPAPLEHEEEIVIRPSTATDARKSR
jgi:hypothetical protein